MKQPYKPYTPTKPTLPSKTWKRPVKIVLDNHNYKSLAELRKEIPENIGIDNIFVEIEHDSDYYSGYESTNVYLVYYIEEQYPEDQYNRSMAHYEKKLKRYHKKCEEYKPKLAAYIEEKEKYDEWFKTDYAERQKRMKDQEIADLKRKLAKLEKKSKK